ncbi:Ig-like domain-containing protein [Bacillus safensis]|uniref:Ig-like domain-containing protein n=1 Tax=Bacillus TaxID=1386 RepID=UPI000F790EBF|nr:MULTISPECIES: Ig-like domain-containing protein [Bacillus]MCM3368951.1 Ig-like domain-containing protein [Bacillus safensis]MDJ0292328.1 Ig-like domain-containing protein [Bacillus safensis]NMW03826.1 Ig-like domain-containing protein [Bacillus safensis]
MKKIMFAFVLSLLLVFPTFAHAEETGAVPASVEVTSVTAADSGIVNYGYGSKYRVGSYYPATFKGTLKDASGNFMPNQPIKLYFEAAIKSYAQTATGTTDENGQFSLTFQVPAGAGYQSYNNAGWSTHYYDIVPVTFTSNDIKLSSNVTSVYHLAYTSRY